MMQGFHGSTCSADDRVPPAVQWLWVPLHRRAEQVSRTGCVTYGMPTCLRVSASPREPRSSFTGRKFPTARCRRGVTLIELLVVIFIVLTVTALAIPIVAPALRGRQIRESSRLVTAYLAGARSEALRTGRATGVIFERFPGLPEMCVNLSRCQVPPPYSGNVIGERVTANVQTLSGVETNVVVASSPWPNPTGNPLARVRSGDLIQFNYQGHIYRLDWDGTNWIIGRFDRDLLPPPGPDTWTMNSDTATQPVEIVGTGVPYQVFRQPTRTSTPPVQLPAGIVIDLNFSGDDNGPFVSRNNRDPDNKPNDPFVGPMPPNLPFPLPATLTPAQEAVVQSLESVMIVFAPDGSVERLYRTVDTDTGISQNLVWRAERPTGPIHFLIGQRDRVPAQLEVAILDEVGMAGVPANQQEDVREEALTRYNLFDLQNLWVTINPRSGLISSTENFAVPDLNDPDGDARPIIDHVRAARTFALEGQAMGGP